LFNENENKKHVGAVIDISRNCAEWWDLGP